MRLRVSGQSETIFLSLAVLYSGHWYASCRS
eukprot:COSAG02_NODE_70728_length_194_cov_33.031579_2_plen_30_part_01